MWTVNDAQVNCTLVKKYIILTIINKKEDKFEKLQLNYCNETLRIHKLFSCLRIYRSIAFGYARRGKSGQRRVPHHLTDGIVRRYDTEQCYRK